MFKVHFKCILRMEMDKETQWYFVVAAARAERLCFSRKGHPQAGDSRHVAHAGADKSAHRHTGSRALRAL